MAKVRRVIEARIVVEDEASNIERSVGFVKTSLKGSCRNLSGGAVVIGLYDDDDELVGLDITGTPSDAMQEMVESLFEDKQ